jgi:hypothetical protein
MSLVQVGTQMLLRLIPPRDIYIKRGYSAANITMAIATTNSDNTLITPTQYDVIGDFVTTATTVSFNANYIVINGINYPISASGTPTFSISGFYSGDIGTTTNVIDMLVEIEETTNPITYQRVAYFTTIVPLPNNMAELIRSEIILTDTTLDLTFYQISTGEITVRFTSSVVLPIVLP